MLEGWELGLEVEPEVRAPSLAALLEAHWLGVLDELPSDCAMTELVLAADRQHARWDTAAIAWWAKRLGLDLPIARRGDSPWWLMMDHRFEEAAERWHAMGCPYEEGVALCFSPLAANLDAGMEKLDRLGAASTRAAIARDLRLAGRRNIPRGMRSTTRSNPAGLTDRELQVATLLAEGLRNVDIAARLVVAPKTVDHHVSAVLTKLAVPNRSAVAAALRRLEMANV